jgi:ribosomal protein S18 acetylase RimI-like enzyme
MVTLDYREAVCADIPVMARLRTAEDPEYGFGEERLRERMLGYFERVHHPQHALMPRAIYVAHEPHEAPALAGYIAGHLTRRFGCQGELQWMYVAPQRRGSEAATELLRMLAGWFASQKARRVCVDVQPENARARRFYARHGAQPLRPSWMVWEDIGEALRAH